MTGCYSCVSSILCYHINKLVAKRLSSEGFSRATGDRLLIEVSHVDHVTNEMPRYLLHVVSFKWLQGSEQSTVMLFLGIVGIVLLISL